jgi:hypothetical protein
MFSCAKELVHVHDREPYSHNFCLLEIEYELEENKLHNVVGSYIVEYYFQFSYLTLPQFLYLGCAKFW